MPLSVHARKATGHILEKAMELFAVPMQSELGRWAEACEKGQVEKAIELFAGMSQGGWIPNVHAYNALITACEKCGNAKKGFELLDEMRQRGLSPDEITYSTLHRTCMQTKCSFL